MAFTSYGGFVNEILSWTDNPNITTAQATSLIAVSENVVNQLLRVREMESNLSINVASGGTAAIPADYIELKDAYIGGTPRLPLRRTTVDIIYDKYPDRSLISDPKYIAREGGNFIFGPNSTAGNVVSGIYYAKPISMASGQTVQSTFSSYPQVYLFAALSHAEPFIGRDPRIQTWEAFFKRALDQANGTVEKEAVSGGALQAVLT